MTDKAEILQLAGRIAEYHGVDFTGDLERHPSDDGYVIRFRKRGRSEWYSLVHVGHGFTKATLTDMFETAAGSAAVGPVEAS